MNQKSFSIKEAFSYGWEVMARNLLFFIAVLLIYFLISLVPDVIVTFIGNPWGRFALSVTGWVVYLIAAIGLVGIALKIYDGEKVGVADLFSYYPLFFRFLVAQILYTVIVFGGLILFVVPGIIFLVRFWFFDYFIVDKGLGPIEALRQSWRITKGKTGRVLLFTLAIMGVSILGALALFVGLLVALPVAMMASVFVYKKLLSQKEEGGVEKEEALRQTQDEDPEAVGEA